jgi:hypothetical protein
MVAARYGTANNNATTKVVRIALDSNAPIKTLK